MGSPSETDPVGGGRGAGRETGDIGRLFETVVNGGYCIGCGSCAATAPELVAVDFDHVGRLQATRRPSASSSQQSPPLLAVCPFSGEALDEDELASRFLACGGSHHERIGRYLGCYVGYVREGDFRESGSSGGMGTWVLHELLERALIDGVLHVHERGQGDPSYPLFQFRVSRTTNELRKGAKSRYYPVEMSEVLQYVQQQPGRYALVGVPCFIKAGRLLACEDPRVSERLAFTVALFCGHLKSARYAGMLSWQVGIHPNDLESIDFRHKLPDGDANHYGVKIRGRREGKDTSVVRRNQEFFGYLWGHGFLKYKACDFCDDVVGETADLSVGDAWLPPYVHDSAGTNIVVTRNPQLHALLEEGIASRRLSLSPVEADAVAASQQSGFYHRREGLAYRLHLEDRKGRWRPRKRLTPSRGHLSLRYRLTFRIRALLSERSHTAFESALREGEFAHFQRMLEPWIWLYGLVNAKSWPLVFYSAWRGTVSWLRILNAGRRSGPRR